MRFRLLICPIIHFITIILSDHNVKFKNFMYLMLFFSIDIPEDKKQLLLSFKPSQSIKKEGDGYVLSTTSPGGGNKDLKFQDGVEFDEEVAPGVVVSINFFCCLND